MNGMHLRLRWASFVLISVGWALAGLGAQAQEAAPLPDLVVIDLTLEPSTPEPNTIANVLVTVANVGQGPAAFFRVVLRVNDRLTGSKTVPGLGPDEETVLTFSWVARPGRQVMRVEANAFDDVAESDRDNNVLERTVEFTPDLVLEAIRFEPEHPRPGEEAEIVITVANTGGRSTQARAALRVQDGRQTLATLFFDPLEPGESLELRARWRPTSGAHLLRLRVDPFERISESDELNNLITRAVDVSTRPPSGADLAVRQIALIPEDPQPGEPVTVSATVENVGSGPSGSFALGFEVDGLQLEPVEVAELAPGESRTVSTSWQAEAGERLIRVKADVKGQVVEADEEDNLQVSYVQVGPGLNRCGQLISLELEAEAVQDLADVFGLSEEAVQNHFLPLIKRDMEEDFEGINVRFTLQRPRGIHSRLRFVAENRQNVLGLAPLDFNNRSKSDTGTVFIGSFIALGRLSSRSLEAVAQAIANTASHEVGHFLGLAHDDEATTRKFRSRNMMAPSNESGTFFEDAFFTPENLEYLRSVLPLACEG